MPDYSKAKIYKLVNNVSTDCYYGSTTLPLSVRKAGHKNGYNFWKKGKHRYTRSFSLFEGNAEVDIILVEKYPCTSKEELHARERYWIENNTCLNKNVPTRSRQEYNIDNKEVIKEKRKKYREDNIEKINEYNKKYNEKNKDHIKKYYEGYYLNNIEKINEYKKEYYQKTKDKQLQKQKEKIECECGSIVRRGGLAEHKKSNKHMKWESTHK